MSIPDYASPEFAQEVGNKTFCGPNAWMRLMSWLDVTPTFQDFMNTWQEQIAPSLHAHECPDPLPDISGILETHFEELYPAQFILRLCQLADSTRQKWLLTALNDEQQEVLFMWIQDSQIEAEKGQIADHWTEALDRDLFSYQGTPLYEGLTSEIFREISRLASNQTKRIR